MSPLTSTAPTRPHGSVRPRQVTPSSSIASSGPRLATSQPRPSDTVPAAPMTTNSTKNAEAPCAPAAHAAAANTAKSEPITAHSAAPPPSARLLPQNSISDSAVGALGVDVVDRRQRLIRCARRRLDRLARAGQAVEHRGDADDLVAGVPERLDRLDRRTAGGADVLDHQAAIRRIERRPLDLALQAVGLGLLA